MMDMISHLIELNIDLMLVTDLASNIVDVNALWNEKLGYSKEELIGKSYLDFVHPLDHIITIEEQQRITNGGKIKLFDNRYIAKTGKIVWLRWNAVLDQQEGRIYSIARDITDLKEKEELAKYFQSAIESSAMVAITDINKKYIHVNQLFAEGLNYSIEELLGMSAVDLCDSAQISLCLKADETVSKGDSYKGELLFKKKSGEQVWLDALIIPQYDSWKNPTRFLGIFHDETIAKANLNRLIQSDKMMTLGLVASGIAHEINNPLSMVYGKSELLIKKIEKKDLSKQEITEDLQKITKAADRIKSIVKNIKSYSRDSSSDPFILTPLIEIIQLSIEICHSKLKAHFISIEILDKENLKAFMRASQIEQVLVNLINNAIDGIEERDEKWIKILTETKKPESVVIKVIDSGSGIPKEVQGKMWESFFTTKETGKGTGLGLSICKKIIEDHRGQIYIDNESENTCFVIELPMNQV